MTASELRALGLARYGRDWQSPLARAIGVSVRHMRRLAADQAAILPGIEADILRALGGALRPEDGWPRDAWIVGDGPEQPSGQRREYVMHTHAPRFVARVIAVDEDAIADPDEAPADTMSGVVYQADGYVLAEITWLDPPPPVAEIQRLLRAACDVRNALRAKFPRLSPRAPG